MQSYNSGLVKWMSMVHRSQDHLTVAQYHLMVCLEGGLLQVLGIVLFLASQTMSLDALQFLL
jgi:hypothetical protein